MKSWYFINSISVAVFGFVLSAAFCGIRWTRGKRLALIGSMAAILSLQGLVLFGASPAIVGRLYPLITHIPLAAVLCILSRRLLWPVVAVQAAYLCCQLRRWLALLAVAVAPGFADQNIAELALTMPLLLVLLRVAAPSVQSISHGTAAVQWQFCIVPALYYGFDYLTRIYTSLLTEGSMVAVEFMPFVCSAAYLAFVLHASAEGQARSRLEQAQGILDMQVAQAVQEIEVLREVQKKNSICRHDLRHHMNYLSSCIEHGRYGQALSYIHGICSEMEKNKVEAFCENEAANLIFSAFAGRMEGCGAHLGIRAKIPQEIPVSESDLCVLLSNALENALHACQTLREKGLPGQAEVTAYVENKRLFLQFTNSCDGDVAFARGVPATDKPGHGLGVQSICAIVAQYGGIYDFSLQDGTFILRLVL